MTGPHKTILALTPHTSIGLNTPLRQMNYIYGYRILLTEEFITSVNRDG